MKTIRPIAICVFRHGDRILVFRGSDPETHEEFLRPFGGGIEFGESAAEAVAREIDEELGESIGDPELLGVLDNRFSYAGESRHEHVFVFDAAFHNREVYDRHSLVGREDNGLLLRGEWTVALEYGGDQPPLYPEGLRELLQRVVQQGDATEARIADRTKDGASTAKP